MPVDAGPDEIPAVSGERAPRRFELKMPVHVRNLPMILVATFVVI